MPAPMPIPPGGGTDYFHNQNLAPFPGAFADGRRYLSRAVADLQQAYTLEHTPNSSPARIRSLYQDARGLFSAALGSLHDGPAATLAGVYNDVAYVDIRLDDPQAALAAANRALQLAPTLAKALENRGEALLALDRTEEAKQDYLTLFAQHRQLADLLLTRMQRWIEAQREVTKPPEATQALDEFHEWVRTRVEIASRSAAVA
jgi:tetratricopeptide (TPR) repeat protein